MWDRRTGRPLHRALVWQDRRTAARCDELREPPATSTSSAGPPAWCSTPTSRPPSWSGCSPRAAWSRSRPGVRHGRRVDAVEPHRRRTAASTPPSRPTPAAPCCSTSSAWPGRRRCTTCSAYRTAACPRSGRPAGRFGATAAGTPVPVRHPGVGHPRRPAGRPVRPGLPRAGADQEHLRHRQLRADERGRPLPRAGRGLLTTVAWTVEGTAGATYAARGLDLRDRRRGAVAARRARPDPRPPPTSARWPRACPTPGGVYLVPAFAGLGSPWWDPVRPGHDRRPHSGHRRGPPGPGRGRGDGVPDPRRGRRHGRGLRPAPSRSCGSTGAPRPWTCCSRSRPTSWACRCRRPVVQETTALGAGLPGRAGRGRVGTRPTMWPPRLAARPALRAGGRPGRGRRRPRPLAAGGRALPRAGPRIGPSGPACGRPPHGGRPPGHRDRRQGRRGHALAGLPTINGSGWRARLRARCSSRSRVSTTRASADDLAALPRAVRHALRPSTRARPERAIGVQITSDWCGRPAVDALGCPAAGQERLEPGRVRGLPRWRPAHRHPARRCRRRRPRWRRRPGGRGRTTAVSSSSTSAAPTSWAAASRASSRGSWQSVGHRPHLLDRRPRRPGGPR